MCLRCPRDTSQRPGATHAQADTLRNLVRIKVADDNDLRTARTGLEECAECFVGIAAGANARGIAEGEMVGLLCEDTPRGYSAGYMEQHAEMVDPSVEGFSA